MRLQKKLPSSYQCGRAMKTESAVQVQIVADVSCLIEFAAFRALAVFF